MTQEQKKQEAFEVIDDGPSLHEIMTVTPVLFLRNDTLNQIQFHLKSRGWRTVFVEGVIWDASQHPLKAEYLGDVGSRAVIICGRMVTLARPFIALYHPQSRQGRWWDKEHRAANTLYGIDTASIRQGEKAAETCAQQLALYQSSLHSLDHATKIQLLKNHIRQATLSDLTKQFLLWFIAESRDLTEQISVQFQPTATQADGYSILAGITAPKCSGQTWISLGGFINDLLGIEVPPAFKDCHFPTAFFWCTSANYYPEIDLAFSPSDLREPFRAIIMTPELLAEIKEIPLV